MGFDVNTRLSLLRASAKARGIHVNLDVNKYQLLIDNGCEFCGKDLSDENGYCLDRVDSNKGYNLANVGPCCKICNRAKSDMDVIDFCNWVQKAAKHLEKRIAEVDKLKKMGMTEEMFIMITEAMLNLEVSNKDKKRIKFVP